MLNCFSFCQNRSFCVTPLGFTGLTINATCNPHGGRGRWLCFHRTEDKTKAQSDRESCWWPHGQKLQAQILAEDLRADCCEFWAAGTSRTNVYYGANSGSSHRDLRHGPPAPPSAPKPTGRMRSAFLCSADSRHSGRLDTWKGCDSRTQAHGRGDLPIPGDPRQRKSP